MIHGDFTKTKEEVARALTALAEMFKAIPKSRRDAYIGHLQCVASIIDGVLKVAPSETKKEE